MTQSKIKVKTPLVELDGELGARGIRLLFGNVRDRVRRDVERALPSLSGGDEVSFASVTAAVQAVPAA